MRGIEAVTISVLLPVMTVESYWPYATTLFDYVRRAMPFQAPGSLTADEVYSVSAYILAEANIIDKTNGASASAGFELLQSDLELTTKAPPHPRALVRFLWPLLLISVCTYIGPDVLYLLRGQRPLPWWHCSLAMQDRFDKPGVFVLSEAPQIERKAGVVL
jgi:hypothetical protein